ncbi:MAG TPA: DNA/RNA non-specific endonuclease [Azospirillaceae bacterium]|nr:DNA/RNA non-specific endonuclease [Azospirillaceae bacterium]
MSAAALACLAALLCPPALAADACDPMLAEVGAPLSRAGAPHVRLCRQGYVLAHDTALRVPAWVAQRLTPDRLQGTADREESGDFAADPELPEDARATLADYAGSGFDRGHMAPAADMKFSGEAMRQSFYLSNMAPQVGPGMNRGIWARLEAMVRDWACERGTVVVLTGPVFDTAEPRRLNGRVAVPDAFWKVAYDPARGEAVAVVLPNAPVKLEGRDARTVLGGYSVTIDELEARTGLDLLPALEDTREAALEARKEAPWAVAKRCPKPPAKAGS